MSDCKYPDCVAGQYGTHCKRECVCSDAFDRADRAFVRFGLNVLGIGLLCMVVLLIWRPWA